jgi:HEAT repeat protein
MLPLLLVLAAEWSTQLQSSDADLRVAGCRGVAAEPGAGSVELLAVTLRTEQDPGVRRACQDALARVELSEDQALALLADADEEIARAWAAHRLGHSGTSAALEGLLAAAQDPSPLVRQEVYEALAGTGSTDAVQVLRRAAVQDPSARLRDLAADSALAAVRSQDGVDVSAELARLQSADPGQRVLACQRLGEAGDWRAVDPLLHLAQADTPEVRNAALLALGHLGDKRAVPDLVAIAQSSSGLVRYNAIAALAWMRDESAHPALQGFLSDPDPATRQLAVRALAWGQAPAVVLEPALGDDAEEVRTEAVLALGELEDPDRVRLMLLALDDESPFIRAEAVRQLAASGAPEAGPALVDLVDDPDRLVRITVAESLTQLGHRDALPALQKQLKQADADEAPYLERAVRALGG